MGICTALYSIYIDMMKNLLLPQHTHEFTQPFNHINLIHVLIHCGVRFQIVSQNQAKNRNCLENWYDKSFLFLFENQ